MFFHAALLQSKVVAKYALQRICKAYGTTGTSLAFHGTVRTESGDHNISTPPDRFDGLGNVGRLLLRLR